ncbi:MAG TPA: hypothetical protein VLF95_10910, partial [Vicinamibacteria bacterium]|nr:hypothetical protein [Vicinamibacteria bacterium]
SLLICAPSLYVFATLLGGDLSGRRFLALVSGFAGMVALLLLGLVPIGWLFSVSSASLSFVVWLHLCLWLLCLAFAARFLSMVLSETGAHRAAVLWVGLFCVVVFQVTTLLRPVLLREPGTPAFVGAKMFFLEQFDRVTEDPTVPPGGKP